MNQIFVRCGGQVGSVALELSPEETTWDLKLRLSSMTDALGNPQDMCLTYGGRLLRDGDLVHVQPQATVHLTHKLCGGGGDGGSTGAESRSCYLEMYAGKKNDKVNPAEEQYAKWTRCHLSGQNLAPPVVIDELGNVYNKESLLHALLHKSLPPALAHINSLKRDVIEARLERNVASTAGPASAVAQHGSALGPGNDAEFCCPITGVPFNGRFKFVALRKTGQVVSEKALKEVPKLVEELLGEKWTSGDLLVINPGSELQDEMKLKLVARMAAEREKKKSKKDAKRGITGVASEAQVALTSGASANDDGPSKVNITETASLSSVGLPSSGLPTGLEAPPAAAAAAVKRGLEGGSELPPKKGKALALESMPKHSTKQIYASLFSSSIVEPQKETYCCRSTSARGVHLT